MTIRTKVIALLVLLFAGLAVSQYLIQQRILLPSFAEFERQSAITDLNRAEFALRNDLEQLTASTGDYGNWVETFEYMAGRRPAYIVDNFKPVALMPLRVNAVAIANRDGRFAWTEGLSRPDGSPLAFDLLTRGQLPPSPRLQAALQAGTQASGYVATDRGPMMIAVSPILDGNGGGPHRGIMLFGRLLTAEDVRLIGSRAQVRLSMQPIDSTRRAKDAAPVVTLSDDEKTVVVERDMADVNGVPLFTLHVETPRTISAQGRATVASASIFLIGAGCVVLLALVWTLTHSVLNPLRNLTRHALAIGHSKDLSQRLGLERTDEFGELGREFDRMVERLEATQRELVDESFHSGIAEMSREVLHNIGNALTPLSIKVSLLEERLRAAPLAETEMALGELGAKAVPDARRLELQEFARLAALELTKVLAVAIRDVELMGELSNRIQRSLAEQMNFSRASRVTESIRLADLVRGGIDGLAPAYQHRLAIEVDPSVESVGTVEVARTTLLRMFQIILQNAAEAVRGTERGPLRISASVESVSGGATLRLRFADRGAGIAPENLGRVFEKGFSTKSAGGRKNVGLHWVANATIALGGTVTAASPGLGEGTTIEINLPLSQPEVAAAAA